MLGLSLLAVAGHVRAARDGTAREGAPWVLRLAGLLVLLTFVGHQAAFSFVDIEFNAGGRYMLGSMAAIALLLVSGIMRAVPERVGRWLCVAWIGLLLAMSAVSAVHLVTVLNPTHAPGWQLLHVPPSRPPI